MFEHYFWSFDPYFGRNPYTGEPLRDRNSRRERHNVEDVSYEDITDTTEQSSKIDKSARARQILDAVMKRSEDILKENPMAGLLFMSVFSLGADWADENPISGFKNREEWITAQIRKVEAILKEADAKTGKSDLLLSATILSIFRDGANWANENPVSVL